MKRTIKAFFVVIFLFGGMAFTFGQDVKLGHCNVQDIMLKMPDRQKAEKKIQEFAKKLETDIRAMNQEYEAKYNEFQQKQDTYTETERQTMIESITDLEQRIMQAQQKAQQDLRKQEQELLEPIRTKVENAIKTVAENNNFSYVFDSSMGQPVYKDGGKDITTLVLKELDLNQE